MIQAGTLLSSLLLFLSIFPLRSYFAKNSANGSGQTDSGSDSGRNAADREALLSVFFGVLLYMTCPYRLYLSQTVSQNPSRLGELAAMALLPLYLWAVLNVRLRSRTLSCIAIAALALAGMGYADVVYFLAAAGVTCLSGVLLRQPRLLLPAAAGSVFFLPGLYRLARYLFLNDLSFYHVPPQSIMPEGYRLGELFHSYFFRNGHPGLGIGLLICLAAGLWIRFVDPTSHQDSPNHFSRSDRPECFNSKDAAGICSFFTALSIFLLVLSLRIFPWDLVQRLGAWALRLVSLIETPAVFVGMASLCLCVPAAFAVKQISRQENRTIAYAIPAVAALSCILVCLLAFRPLS